MINTTEIFIKNLKEWRIKAGLSQRRLAELSNVAQATISNIESGSETIPRRKSIERIMEVLGFAIEDAATTKDHNFKEEYVNEKELRLEAEKLLFEYQKLFNIDDLEGEDKLIVRQLVNSLIHRSKHEKQIMQLFAVSPTTVDFLKSMTRISQQKESIESIIKELKKSLY